MTVARAMFPKAKEPRYAFEVLVRLLPEATLKFTRDGISLRAVDPTASAASSSPVASLVRGTVRKFAEA